MPPISLLIKPASGLCNLNCKYCFYNDLSKNQNFKQVLMNNQTTENLISKVMDFADDFVNFAFQGGEPTLAGIDYFKNFVKLVNKYNKKNIKIDYSIQTNGTLLNQDFAKFLSENKFFVGLSLDGTQKVNDINRIYKNGNGTFKEILNAKKILDEYNIEYNVLCVITNHTAKNINNIYDFFKQNNIFKMQFIPCLTPIESDTFDECLSNSNYLKFLKNLFDKWYNDIKNGKIIYIRYFENILMILLNMKPEICGMTGTCNNQMIVESNGNVYPCDFYVIDKYLIGNFNNNDFNDFEKNLSKVNFIESSLHIHNKCKVCKWYNLCAGGCRRYKEHFSVSNPSLYRYCNQNKEFFNYSIDRFLEIAQIFK